MNPHKAKVNVKLIALTFTAILLGSILGYIWNSYANPVSPTVYLDDLPATAYYTVKTDGSGNYWCIRFDGFKAEESTNAATTINWALDNLPSGRTYTATVYVQGSMPITASVDVHSYSNLLIDGKWTLGADVNMITATSVTYISIQGVGYSILELSKDSGYTGSGVSITTATYFTVAELLIRNFKASANGLYLHDCGRAIIRDLDIECQDGDPAGGNAVYLDNFYDSKMSNIFGSPNVFGYALYGVSCSSVQFVNLYFGGASGGSTVAQVYFLGGHTCQVIGLQIDSPYFSGMKLDGLNNFIFTDVRITRPLTNGYVGIYLSNAINNTITNFLVGHKEDTSDELYTWAYGIQEAGTSNRNLILDGRTTDCTTAGIKIIGANSHVSDCYNMTTWVT